MARSMGRPIGERRYDPVRPRVAVSQRGATLVEVLVGTALAGLILAAVAVIELQAVRHWGSTVETVTLCQQVREAVEQVLQDVRSSVSFIVGADELRLWRWDGTSVRIYRQDGALWREAGAEPRRLLDAIDTFTLACASPDGTCQDGEFLLKLQVVGRMEGTTCALESAAASRTAR